MRPESASVESVRAALERGRRRLLARDLLRAAVVAAVAVAAGLAFPPFSARAIVSLSVLAVGTVAGFVAIRRQSRTASRVAVLMERQDPSLKNLLVTAEELLRHPD